MCLPAMSELCTCLLPSLPHSCMWFLHDATPLLVAGVPSGLRFWPGLMDAVKGAVGREAEQLFDKLAYVADKVGVSECVCVW